MDCEYEHPDSLGSRNQTLKSTKGLKSYTIYRICPLYSVNIPIKHRGRLVNAQFEIMELEQENIISGDVADKLHLIERTQNLDDKSDNHPKFKFKDFPELTRTSGTLPCHDPSDLNKEVKKAHHPLIKVKYIVSNKPNARDF